MPRIIGLYLKNKYRLKFYGSNREPTISNLHKSSQNVVLL